MENEILGFLTNKRLIGHSYRNFSEVGRRHCEKQCLAGGSCQSVNYRAEKLFCQLFGIAEKEYLTSDKGYEYIEKSDLSKRYDDPCVEDPCPVLQTCIKLSSGIRKCVITECGTPPNVAHASVINSRAQTSVGESVRYSCNIGFKFVQDSLDSTMCMASGSYEDVYIKCENVTCSPTPPQLTNGVVSYSSYVYGSLAVYKCRSGYGLSNRHSKAYSVCQLTGLWGYLSVTCKGTCPPPPDMTNAHIVSWPMNRTTVGSEVQYQCQTDHSMDNGKELFVITCGQDGDWSPQSVTCYPNNVTCPPPPHLTNGYIALWPMNRTTVGSEVQYQCQTDHSMDNGKELFVITCGQDGDWSPQSVTCYPNNVTCPPPPHLTNGYIALWPMNRTTVGAEVQYQCQTDHSLDNGNGSFVITCGEDGEWSPLSVTCNPNVTCISPPHLTNGHIVSWSMNTTTVGAEVQYQCQTDHSLDNGNGSFVITCGEDGEWSPLSVTCNPNGK
ncbi:complement factor H-like [Argopecten irradians]|uniref:complement factor H-like n=1 Tax=Argopecten irradians TaxID=31199 RepID=UPI0037211113